MPSSSYFPDPVTPYSIHRVTGVKTTYPGYAARPLSWNKSITDTVKRVKPTDLFANCTVRQGNWDPRVVEMLTGWYDPGGNVYWYGPVSFFTGNAGLFTSVNSLVNTSFSDLDSKLRARIKAQNLNLAQTLAEYRQTSSMFVSLTSDVLRTFRSLRSGRALGDFVRSLQKPRDKHELAIANRWLQYQYGIKPLMSDLYGSVDALASKIRTGMWHYVSTSDIETRKFSGTPTGPWGNPIRNTDSSWNRRNVRARYLIRDAALKQLAQLGITNPLLLAWELIPYSFVFDWIIPVGDFLSSLDSMIGVSNLQVIRSRKYWTMNEKVFLADGAKTTYTVHRYDRFSLDSNLSLPQLSYKPSKSLLAVANGVALLRQLRK